MLGESSKEKEEEEESAQAADSEAVDERDQPANGKSFVSGDKKQHHVIEYCIRHNFRIQIFPQFWTRSGNSQGLNFMQFSDVFITINRHKQKWKFSRGLTCKIHENKTTAKITTYTVHPSDDSLICLRAILVGSSIAHSVTL